MSITSNEDNSDNKSWIVVRGIRYVVPYLHQQKYSVRLQDADRGLSVLQVLVSRLGRPYLPSADVEAYFRGAIVTDGRVSIRRHKKNPNLNSNDNNNISKKRKTGPNGNVNQHQDISHTRNEFQRLVDPDLITARGDILKIQNHVHERCTIYRGPLVTILDIADMTASRSAMSNFKLQEEHHYRAIYKPAGLPVVNDEGLRYGCVAGMVRDEHNYHLGHRLDMPVEGVLLLGKGKKRAAKLMRALSPQAKQQSQSNGTDGSVLKAYLARVKGGSWFRNNKDEAGNIALPSPMHEVRRWLKWDTRSRKAIVVSENEINPTDHNKTDKQHQSSDGRGETAPKETITRIQQLLWDDGKGESLIRVELVTGARHQIRAVVASLGLPIKGDITYGDEADIGIEEGRDGDFDKAAREDSTIGGCTGKGGASLLHRNASTAVTTKEKSRLLLYADDDQGSLFNMLSKHRVDWCDKCRWQIDETKKGGTSRGAEQLGQAICLLSYHYRIPSLGIDVRVPDHMLPEWASTAHLAEYET